MIVIVVVDVVVVKQRTRKNAEAEKQRNVASSRIVAHINLEKSEYEQ